MTANKPPHSVPLCPICKQAERAKAYRPFCSRQCADIDLYRWLGEDYAIPAPEPVDERDLEIAEKEAQDAHGEAQSAGQGDEKPQLH